MDLDLSSSPYTSPPNTETDTPPHTQILSINPLSLTNGALTIRHRLPPLLTPVTYRECMKNHAASLGRHAVDGCGEFMPSITAANSSSTLICAACGCHRNFHRREPDDPSPTSCISTATPAPFLDFRRPELPPPQSYMMPSSHGMSEINPVSRKRSRTKFSGEQKQRMQSFAEKRGWKMQGGGREEIEEFCREIGVSKGVLKVWMHNNKNAFCRRNDQEKTVVNGSHLQNVSGGGDDDDHYHVSNNNSSISD